MAYWVTTFTVKGWEQCQSRGFRIAGFPAPTPGPGGYFEASFKKVNPGDLLCCYVKAPARRWVGVLRVEGPWFLDERDPVWGRDQSGVASLPARFPTHPLVAHPVELGLPMDELRDELAAAVDEEWRGLARRSLTRIPDSSGELMLRLIKRRRHAAPVPIGGPDGRTSVASPTGAPRGESPAASHRELIWLLVELGRRCGLDVWVATRERAKVWNGHELGKHALGELPRDGLGSALADLLKRIDVVWLRDAAPVAIFEVETKAAMQPGLLRLADLVASRAASIPLELFVVVPDSRALDAGRQLERPAFDALDPPLGSACQLLPASALRAWLDESNARSALDPGRLGELVRRTDRGVSGIASVRRIGPR